MNPPIYLDYAAAAPPFSEALSAFAQASIQFFGNPSSVHAAGCQARETLERIKDEFLGLCGFTDACLILTSGATEANNTVLRGFLDSEAPSGERLLIAADVHASAWFAKLRYEERVDVVPLEPDGRISLEKLEALIQPETKLVSVAHASNETGVIHDLESIVKTCSAKGVRVHGDGAQTLGHVPVDHSTAAPDFYTFSAHKFGGPRGVGGILLKEGGLEALMLGGGQELGYRAGTENVPGLAGALAALRQSLEIREEEAARLREGATWLIQKVTSEVSDVLLNSPEKGGLPGFVSLSFAGIIGTALVTELSLRGYCVSSGSACQAGQSEPSRTILGLGRSESEALGTVRISMGRGTMREDIESFAEALCEIVERQRALA